ncbi:MAG: PEP/pyruvate-binding domain-containing protein, partial [Planctomycetota bacterium]
MHKTELVIPLQAIQNSHAAAVGPKTLSLAKMTRLALPVPPGFCVTTSAYRQHLSSNNIMPKIQAALNNLENAIPKKKPAILSRIREAIVSSNNIMPKIQAALNNLENAIPKKKPAILSRIREAIVQPPISAAIRQEIEAHYKALRADRIAVRSSATAEDLPGHSFAGLYDTYLGVANVDDCIDAVKKCWASLWTERAYEYRQKNGFDHLLVNMAVIVQSLITADASGVIFTADPASGRREQIVVEACFGLGNTLVSGKLTPDRFVINKNNLKVVSETISEKRIESVLDESSSVKEQTVPADRASTCSISTSTMRKLAKLAKRVEAEFDCPQDIEWALRGRKIYLLQSRPITALPPPKSWQDRQIWCSIPAREVLPDVVTPIMFSIIQAFEEDLFDPLFRMLCIDRRGHPSYGLIAGRLYFNLSTWASVIRSLPCLRRYDFRKLAGSHRGLLQALETLRNTTDDDLPQIKFSRLRFIAKSPLIIIRIFANTPGKGRSILAKTAAHNKKWARIDLTNSSAEEILKYCRDIITDFRRLMRHMLYMLSTFVTLPILHIACERWLCDDGPCAGKLLAGLGEMDDAVAGLDLWRLAVAADKRPQVKNLMLSDYDWHTIEPKLSQTDSGNEFLESWRRFMERHGHHCRAELELYNPRWSQTPAYILKLVRSYISQIGKTDPIQNCNNLRLQRRQLEQQCRSKLTNPVKRAIFSSLLVRSQQGSIFRENVKGEVIKLLAVIRRILLEIGRRLTKKGVLKHQDDIFFLSLEEIQPAVLGKADLDIRQVVAARRAEYHKSRSIIPPDVVFGIFDPDNYIPDPVDTDVKTLTGLAVSPGVVTGKARVILRADSDQHVLAGEILIAPFTDPGWTPYFVPAAAIVMDQGGLLSHGSIIAREYGIPAVVNVGPATKIIKTGQTIQVDGDHGIVTVL